MDADDLKIYKSKTNGRMGDTEVVTGQSQNLLTHISSTQRAAGGFDYFECWWQVDDDDDGVGVDPELFLDYPTLSDDDYVMLFDMNTSYPRALVSTITGYATGTDTETKFGTAYLADNITAGDQTFDVTVKHADMASGDDAIFRDTVTIKISGKATALSVSGSEETHTLDGAPVVASDGITLTLTIADSGGFANSWTADGTLVRVSSIFEPTSDVETAYDSFTVTTAGDGDYDDTTYPITLDNMGTVDEDWTLYFTDATHFRLDGDTLGTGVATGDTSTNFSPNNSGRSKPYFTLDYNGFSGTYASGDEITFTTTPAGVKIGLKRAWPAATGSLANNKVSPVLIVEAGS